MQNYEQPLYVRQGEYEFFVQPLSPEENERATFHIMRAITTSPQSQASSILLAVEAVNDTSPEAKPRAGRMGMRELDLVDPAQVDFMPRLDRIHKTFGITYPDGSPVKIPPAMAAFLMKDTATVALRKIRESLQARGALSHLAATDYATAAEIHRILAGDSNLCHGVLEDLKPEYDEVLAGSAADRKRALATHTVRQQMRTDAGEVAKAVAPRTSRIAHAIGSLTARFRK